MVRTNDLFHLEPDRGLGGGPHVPLLPGPRPDRVCRGQGLAQRSPLPVPGRVDRQAAADRAGQLPAR